MGFFDLQLTPEELARSRRCVHSTRAVKEQASVPRNCNPPLQSKPRLKEIIRRRPLALVWINPNPPHQPRERT